MILRPANLGDSEAFYAISTATGDGGRDAAPLHDHARTIGDLYSVPYLHLAPELSFVIEDEEGVGGFVVGSRDTRAFAARLGREWLPQRQAAYPAPDTPWLNRHDRARIEALHAPPETPEAVISEYPAHMHMNLDARLRGRGAGRRLFERFLDALGPDAPGLHIGAHSTNAGGIAFWHAMGFRRLGSSTAETVWMGRSTI